MIFYPPVIHCISGNIQKTGISVHLIPHLGNVPAGWSWQRGFHTPEACSLQWYDSEVSSVSVYLPIRLKRETVSGPSGNEAHEGRILPQQVPDRVPLNREQDPACAMCYPMAEGSSQDTMVPSNLTFGRDSSKTMPGSDQTAHANLSNRHEANIDHFPP